MPTTVSLQAGSNSAIKSEADTTLICNIKRTIFRVVHEEGWFGQPKYSTLLNYKSTLYRPLLLS